MWLCVYSRLPTSHTCKETGKSIRFSNVSDLTEIQKNRQFLNKICRN